MTEDHVDAVSRRLGLRADLADQERARIDAVRAQGAVPASVGPEIPDAPARGPFKVFDTFAAYPKGDDQTEIKQAGFQGRKTMQRADVFDVMRAQAAKRGGTMGLAPEQVGMARTYSALVERHSAGAMRCSSIEAMPSGGGGGSDGFTDARLASVRKIDMLRARVGDRVAIEVRRVRPSKRAVDGAPRSPVTDMALVEGLAVHGKSISTVLREHGWSGNNAQVKAATSALAAALDRMIGPRRRGGILAARTDVPRWL